MRDLLVGEDGAVDRRRSVVAPKIIATRQDRPVEEAEHDNFLLGLFIN